MQDNLRDCATQRKLLVSGKYPWNGLYNHWEQDYGFVIFDRIKDVLLSRPWSSIIWDGGRRLEEKFISSDWLVLDYDEHVLTLEQAEKNFCDYQNIISVTRSHTDDCHHLRVCIPWAERITDVEVFKYNFKKNAEFYDSDLRALTAARFFWPSKGIYSVNTDGEQMEVEDPPRATVDDFDFIQPERPANRELPKYYFEMVKNGLEHGATGRNQPLWQLCKDLLKEFWDDREIIDLIKRIKCKPAYRDRDYEKCLHWAKVHIKKKG
jgi:hypothetical protein